MLPIEALYRAARAWPARLAVEGGGVAITYRELVEQVDALAVGLQALDPAPQSRVGICAWNTVEHLLALLATFAAGKVWVPLNPRNGPAELAAMSVGLFAWHRAHGFCAKCGARSVISMAGWQRRGS